MFDGAVPLNKSEMAVGIGAGTGVSFEQSGHMRTSPAVLHVGSVHAS